MAVFYGQNSRTKLDDLNCFDVCHRESVHFGKLNSLFNISKSTNIFLNIWVDKSRDHSLWKKSFKRFVDWKLMKLNMKCKKLENARHVGAVGIRHRKNYAPLLFLLFFFYLRGVITSMQKQMKTRFIICLYVYMQFNLIIYQHSGSMLGVYLPHFLSKSAVSHWSICILLKHSLVQRMVRRISFDNSTFVTESR